jgi:glucosamine--fructose-6-phosphate aminotransferase (isomerizing)
MCGIMGYLGSKDCVPVMIEGLYRMEYRGYDSAGISVLNGNAVKIVKQRGKIRDLEKSVVRKGLSGHVGIGHTRWATHGEPSRTNAHPHSDCTHGLALVHNGIIENYASLKEALMDEGHVFHSDTDTEVLAHLIEDFYRDSMPLEHAVIRALKRVVGAYGIAVIHKNEPEKIVVARQGSPLVIGVGEGENFVASDAAALIAHTKNVIYLDDGEISVLTSHGITTYNINAEIIEKNHVQLDMDLEEIEKGNFPHFMLKEIYEQASTVYDAMRGRLVDREGISRLHGIADFVGKILNAQNVYITACGTSWHAALIGEYMLESLVKIPVEVEYASEFRYRDPLIGPKTVVFVISQSGETADSLATIRETKAKGGTALGIVNVVGSTIARETDAGIYIHAGPEIGVASTKAFTSQVTVFALISLLLGRQLRTIGEDEGKEMVRALRDLPAKIKAILADDSAIQQIAEIYKNTHNALYLGRGYNFPVALEGALKMKELSYIHAEGYPAAEMKHGPIALIDENMPVVFIALHDSTYEKVLCNMEEVKARRGKIIAIASEGDGEIQKYADHIIYIPQTAEFIQPILSVIPLQLLSYYTAVMRGCDVDQPRNLAKSVTVE